MAFWDGWFTKKEETPKVALVGHEVKIVRGAPANMVLVERAKGRIDRLKDQRSRHVKRGKPGLEVIDASIKDWEDQLAFSLRRIRSA